MNPKVTFKPVGTRYWNGVLGLTDHYLPLPLSLSALLSEGRRGQDGYKTDWKTIRDCCSLPTAIGKSWFPIINLL